MPEAILAVTFTNKAAAEMAERVEKLVGGLSITKPVISTFHSFCVRVLRRDIEALRIPSTVPGQPPIGLTKNFVIYDENDQQSVVKSVMRRLGLDDKELTPRIVLSRISWAKNHMLNPQEVYLQSADPKTERVAHIYEELSEGAALKGERDGLRRSAAGGGTAFEVGGGGAFAKLLLAGAFSICWWLSVRIRIVRSMS